MCACLLKYERRNKAGRCITYAWAKEERRKQARERERSGSIFGLICWKWQTFWQTGESAGNLATNERKWGIIKLSERVSDGVKWTPLAGVGFFMFLAPIASLEIPAKKKPFKLIFYRFIIEKETSLRNLLQLFCAQLKAELLGGMGVLWRGFIHTHCSILSELFTQSRKIYAKGGFLYFTIYFLLFTFWDPQTHTHSVCQWEFIVFERRFNWIWGALLLSKLKQRTAFPAPPFPLETIRASRSVLKTLRSIKNQQMKWQAVESSVFSISGR